ncbi:MAG TPA: DUF349 domain-containing protein [Steroidobacteraceae bacterium]|nr:DUF349 domain-containing protein [Steroidobacteraceae bacterium]
MRFLRPARPSPPTVETRIAALDEGSSEEVTAVALGDAAEALRVAAVRKLPDGTTLRKLAGLSEDAAPPESANLERIAQERVAQLIDSGSIDFAELRTSTRSTTALLSVAGLCSNPDLLSRELSSIDDPQRLASLAVAGSSSRVRQLAAQLAVRRIEDPAELARLLKQVRGKDKSVYRIVKHKCDALHAEEQRIAQIASDAAALCASLERHSRRVHDALYATSFKLLHEQWQTLEPQAAPDLKERALLAIDRCREVIGAHSQRLARRAEEETQQAARKTARDEATAAAELEAQRLDEAAALAAAQAAAQREAEERTRNEKLAADALALRQVGGLIGKAHSALQDGNTARAAGLRRAIEEKLPAVPTVPASLASRVQQLDLKLNELKEWKDYAVAPKRAELIEEMESLIGSEETPRALADRIKRLQDEWKTISKGIVSDAEADWQRFHQAAQAAYEPCREYFEAQARLRQENVEKRRLVLERLRAFEGSQSGEQPDWRAVAAVLREAPQEWRRHSPVERTAGLAIQQEFDATIDRLQARLDAWYANNLSEKKSLIQRAQQLRTMEDTDGAVDAVKRLQLQWKNIGGVQRDQEQPLWDEFRAQCDAIFQRRQQAYAEHAAGLEANKRLAVRLCEEAERLSSLADTELLEGAAKIPQWRTDFEALGEVPKADQRGLRDRFERALTRCQAQISQMRARDKERSFTNLLEAGRLIQSYGWAVARGGASADLEALKQAAELFIARVPQWPKGGTQALKEAWAKADAAAGLDVAANENALRMLCIRGEILTDRPTPPEDQDLRRAYQVQRLVRGMGQRGEADAEDLDAFALEWVRVGPVPAAAHEALLARFLRCRN